MTKLLIEINAPSLIVEKKVFRDLFPSFYKDRETYTNNLSKLYTATKMNIKVYLESVDYINIYVDEWTRFNLNFVGIFCSTIEKDALLACGLPNNLSRSSNALGEYISSQLSSYNIQNKIRFCSTDCAPNIASAIINLKIDWNPCSCHVVNKAIEKALNTIRVLRNIPSLR